MAPVAATMKRDFPEVKEAARIQQMGETKTFYKNQFFRGDKFAFADPEVFSIFSLPFIEGDPKTALQQPHTIVITKAAAEKFFGNEEAIGKVLGFDDNKESFKVTGVIENIPANSHFHFDMLASMTSFEPAKSDSWMNGGFHTYLLLKPGAHYQNVEARFPEMVEKYMGPQIQKEMGLSLTQFRSKGNQLGFSLQPLTSIHLNSYTSTEFEPGGNRNYVYILGVIGLFMLAVACINFINLSTAAATKRAKEVGVRKAIGSEKSQLIKQFLIESICISVFSLAIAALLVKFAIPAFNQISGKQLVFDLNPVLGLIVFGLFVGFIAGIYPAFYLSSFKAISVLKGQVTRGDKSFNLRSGLVI
ncbi:MAG TPA: FtsX-like permease family protein, partial [Puia sp.]|nr:FtsX-like permease family protein [Puia sp.]